MEARPQTEDSALVALGRVKLFTRSVGDGPDVVVLHGGPGTGHDFLLPHFDPLAVRRRLRYYDQRGSGRSAVPPDTDMSWSMQVEDLSQLLAHWQIQRASLIGYSWGGLLALLFALAHPASVDRLALVAPAPVSAGGRARMVERFKARLQDPRLERLRQSLNQSGLRQKDLSAYRQRAFELSVFPYFRDPSLASSVVPFLVSARVRDAVWRSLGDYDLTDRLSALSLAAVVLHGRHDPIPLDSSEQIAESLQAPLEVFENSGHLPFVEEPERFVAVLDEFLPGDRK